MEKEKAAEALRDSVIDYDEEKAKELATKLLGMSADPVEIIEKYLIPAMKVVGERFEKGEYYLPHLMLAGDAMKAATEILTASLSGKDREVSERRRTIGTVVIGTVEGDLHDIGKKIVALLLEVNGFNVYDLGREVSPMTFVEKAKTVNADIIALSSLMSTTMAYQAETIKYLKELGQREKYMVIVGGGPTSESWAEEIGADGWAKDASGAVELAKRIVECGECGK